MKRFKGGKKSIRWQCAYIRIKRRARKATFSSAGNEFNNHFGSRPGFTRGTDRVNSFETWDRSCQPRAHACGSQCIFYRISTQKVYCRLAVGSRRGRRITPVRDRDVVYVFPWIELSKRAPIFHRYSSTRLCRTGRGHGTMNILSRS